MLVKFVVIVLLCLCHGWVEDPDLVPVKDLDGCLFKVGWVVSFGIEVPVLIAKETKALADASTLWLFICTSAAIGTVWNRFDRGVRKSCSISVLILSFKSVHSLICCRAIKHQPSSRKP